VDTYFIRQQRHIRRSSTSSPQCWHDGCWSSQHCSVSTAMRTTSFPSAVRRRSRGAWRRWCSTAQRRSHETRAQVLDGWRRICVVTSTRFSLPHLFLSHLPLPYFFPQVAVVAVVVIDGPKARGPWANPNHKFLARHDHGPSMIISGMGRHQHNVGLCWAATSAHSVGPTQHKIKWHDATHVLARGLVAHLAQLTFT
jgi:hypothetical protein